MTSGVVDESGGVFSSSLSLTDIFDGNDCATVCAAAVTTTDDEDGGPSPLGSAVRVAGKGPSCRSADGFDGASAGVVVDGDSGDMFSSKLYDAICGGDEAVCAAVGTTCDEDDDPSPLGSVDHFLIKF